MLRITKITDYAIVLLAEMAKESGLVQARALSERTRIPRPTVAKILKSLVHARLLYSRRGIGGGYALARPAKCIWIIEIIEALEGPVAITECSVPSSVRCDDTEHCGLHGHWTRINAAVRQTLADMSLEEVCRPLPSKVA